jgi:prevent-host-death family protein
METGVHYFCTGVCTYVLYIMMNVNVTELRQNLPTYLKRVRQGERIRVTSRGQVIAELAPPAKTAEAAVLARRRLRGSLVRYEQPFEPALAPEEWAVNQ